LGFWSLAFVWAGTGPVDFIYGAGPDWLETLGGAFSIALLVPVFVIFTDLALAMRGRWIDVRDRVTLRFVIAGAALFALLPVYNLLLALRTSSAAVQFTEWIPGFDVVAFYGAFTLWICAFAYHALSGGRGPRRAGIARWHLRLSLLGILLAAAAMTLGGLATGFTWAAGANAGEPTTFGEGFEAVVDALAPYLVLRTIGLAIFVIAQILFLVSVFGRSADEPDEPSDLVDRFRYDLAFEAVARTPSWRSLRYGALILFLGAFTVTFVLPIPRARSRRRAAPSTCPRVACSATPRRCARSCPTWASVRSAARVTTCTRTPSSAASNGLDPTSCTSGAARASRPNRYVLSSKIPARSTTGR
jgi:hypothetical protein